MEAVFYDRKPIAIIFMIVSASGFSRDAKSIMVAGGRIYFIAELKICQTKRGLVGNGILIP